ncbi:MAG: hypothetical protein CTY34_11900 [Methylobacter sp.]|nr:MAG: hypothetical protein CTY34_11900 [Methylobacter sp.]PPD23191.1 MAG: hypothetical protein CTY24_05205 [Methylobacter sp.]PPD36232.1 MAG: hypothetical protein CTY18_05175 [Methylomonas sp.]
MKKFNRLLLGTLVVTAMLGTTNTFAGGKPACRINGTVSYVYTGTSFAPTGNIQFSETGILEINRNNSVSGEGTITFQFPNFNGQGPLWLLLNEVQTNGVITQDPANPCVGNADFLATATVVNSSNPAIVPPGFVLYADAQRSISFAAALKGDQVNLISTSPGTIASGTGFKQ